MSGRTEEDHLSLPARMARGEQARVELPLTEHEGWQPAPERRDPVELLVEQNRTREAELVPLRHRRMMASPFTFYRGAAKVMAADLATTPTAGLITQLCGDAHLSNFGGYASPERQIVFGLNDFDETLPGPFEYDVKRMAASFTIAAQHNGFPPGDTRAVTIESVRAYRVAMAEFAALPTLAVWYAHLSEQDVLRALRTGRRSGKQSKAAGTSGKKRGGKGKGRKEDEARIAKLIKDLDKRLSKARRRDSLDALPRLAELVGGSHRIVSQPPAVVPLRDLARTWDLSPEAARETVEQQFHRYQTSLSADRRRLLARFTLVDMARKVVGVGSVGTRAFIVLLEGRDSRDPLFLQVKEASRSVLEDHLPRTTYRTAGQRVVEGQRMMQATSDIFLGWTKGVEEDRFYYWRQLRDMKTSALVEAMTPFSMNLYARPGRTLAHAHARSGDPVAIAHYLGDSDAFDEAVAHFSAPYAEQNQRDFDAFTAAVAAGRIDAEPGV